MNEEIVREQIIDIGKRMYERRMVAANDGNISVRISDNEVLCTPTGVSKGFMNPEMIVKIDMQGNVISAHEGYRPSSEVKMHLRVYERRPDIKAVVHAHPTYATIYAIAEKPLDKPIMTEAVVALDRVPVAPLATPSTKEVPDSIECLVEEYDALLLSHHGALTYAPDIMTAYMRMESVEFYAELLYKTRLAELDKEITGEALDKLYEVREKMGFGKRH